jgi:hypothetical protein
MSIYDQLEEYYPEIIVLMPDRFDSHQFILKLAQRYQPLYVQALARHKEEPFRKVHAELSDRLHKFEGRLVHHLGVTHSENIFREVSEAAEWTRVP